MIRVNRTAFIEQPNGDLVCTVTVPFEERTGTLNGHAVQVELGALPVAATAASCGESAHDVDWPLGEFQFRSAREDEANRMAASAIHALSHDPLVVEFDTEHHGAIAIDTAQSVTSHPVSQTVGVGGFDSAQVVEAVASGQFQWDHPAAPHMARIFRHEPFQRYAMERLHADAFAAPMECATRLITKAVKGKPMDAAVAALSRTMDEYMAWASRNLCSIWPE